jgi:hypothetical protein
VADVQLAVAPDANRRFTVLEELCLIASRFARVNYKAVSRPKYMRIHRVVLWSAFVAVVLGIGPTLAAPAVARLAPGRRNGFVDASVQALALPDTFRRIVLRQSGSYDTIDYYGPRLWWHREPAFFWAGLRFAMFAVPFWFVLWSFSCVVFARAKRG